MMKTLLKTFLTYAVLASSLVYLSGCDDDDDPNPQLTGDSKTYTLNSVSDPDVSGTVTFAERDDDQILVTIQLTGTESGSTHPAHIHAGSAAAGGSIVIDLLPVKGADGKSETVVKNLNDGTAVTYEGLLDFDGHVNVHKSETDLTTYLAQGDIGENELTGQNKVYTLTPVADPLVTGTATFAQRKKGTTLVTVDLDGAQPASSHPSHIHANTIAQGGGIVINLKNVENGLARTSVDTLNNGAPISYEELLNFNGYLNVHTGSTFVGQADIGGNELTGDKKVYTLTPVANPAVTGTATFAKRKKGTSLVTVDLDGTAQGESHPSHIHANSIAEGGSIVINLKNVDGTTGMAVTSVDTLNNGTAISYEELLDFNGYLNVHKESTFVVQGDIGANELTGDKHVYTMIPVADQTVSGTTTFEKRKNGSTLVTVDLENTQEGANHPSHIHANTIAEGGSIVINLKNVDGTTGMARTTVRQLNSGTAVTYDELLDFNGYLNVHTGSTFVAQVDIGQNELTGDEEEYVLGEQSVAGVSGTATFAERKNGKTLITIALIGTTDGGDHPAHIHEHDAATGGGIVLDLKNVSGATGKSATSVSALKSGTAISYDELINFDGHINVHKSAAELNIRIAQGNIGSNAP